MMRTPRATSTSSSCRNRFATSHSRGGRLDCERSGTRWVGAPMDLICLTPDEFEQASEEITLVAAALPDAVDLLPVAD